MPKKLARYKVTPGMKPFGALTAPYFSINEDLGRENFDCASKLDNEKSE